MYKMIKFKYFYLITMCNFYFRRHSLILNARSSATVSGTRILIPDRQRVCSRIVRQTEKRNMVLMMPMMGWKRRKMYSTFQRYAGQTRSASCGGNVTCWLCS